MSSFGCGKKRQVQKVSNVVIYVSIPFETTTVATEPGVGGKRGGGVDEQQQQQQQQQQLEVTNSKLYSSIQNMNTWQRVFPSVSRLELKISPSLQSHLLNSWALLDIRKLDELNKREVILAHGAMEPHQ